MEDDAGADLGADSQHGLLRDRGLHAADQPDALPAVLLFPEKRSFFLEGSDAFDFGLGEGLRAFHSRKIGLVSGTPVPLHAGARVIGRSGGTSLGALVADTGDEPGVAPETTMGVVRLRQDVLAESNVGVIGTFGDPLGRSANTRLRWDLTPASQLFFVVNYNFFDPGGAFDSDGYEATIEIQHEVRF